MTRLVQLTAALALAAAVAACGGSSTASTLTAPSGILVTDTFNGTVPVAGLDFHAFTVTTGGTVNITLLAAGPPPTITMGLALGTPSGTTCALISGAGTTTAAGTTSQLTGSLAAGAYCVEVFDVGNAASPISYTVAVAHT
ncbi:MAG TPA: hypothetical protein VMT70_15655 [Vicinamibacteria bacterium]|nr:hypothetical protein [Vicinamibacteria bacterium]